MGCGASKPDTREAPQQPAGQAPVPLDAIKDDLRQWVDSLPVSGDARGLILAMFASEEIGTLGLLRGLEESSLIGLEGFSALKTGVREALKKSYRELKGEQEISHHVQGPEAPPAAQPHREKEEHNPSTTRARPDVAAHQGPLYDMDLTRESIGKLRTTLETLISTEITRDEVLVGHFTSQTALQGIRKKGFRVSKEGQGAGGVYVVSSDSLGEMLSSKANKFDRECFLSTAFSLFGPNCEKRRAQDIEALLLLRVKKVWVQAVPLDEGDERSQGAAQLSYIPKALVDDLGQVDPIDGCTYLQWQSKIIKAYRVFTPENIQGTLAVKDVIGNIRKRHQEATRKLREMQSQPASANTAAEEAVDYPVDVKMSGQPFHLKGFNGPFKLLEGSNKNGRPIWRRAGVWVGPIPIVPVEICWNPERSAWALHRDNDPPTRFFMHSNHSNPTPVGLWEKGVTVDRSDVDDGLPKSSMSVSRGSL